MIKKQTISITLKNENSHDSMPDKKAEQSFLFQNSSKDSLGKIDVNKNQSAYIRENNVNSCEFYGIDKTSDEDLQQKIVETFLHTEEIEQKAPFIFEMLNQGLIEEKEKKDGE